MQGIITCTNCKHVESQLFGDTTLDVCSNCGSIREVKFLYTQEELDKTIETERNKWIIRMLEIRDLISTEEEENIADEVYHFIYSIVDPKFEKLNPWEEWEALAKNNKIIIDSKALGLGEV